MRSTDAWMADLSAAVARTPESGIVELVNRGRNKEGLIPLWVGEGDLPTPGFIAEAAINSLRDGETFYTYQRGHPDLQAALARYHRRHFGIDCDPDRFIVTGSGMQAIQIAVRALIEPGDEALYLTPAWPNFAAAVDLADGVAVPVPLDRSESGWSLDPDRLAAAVTEKTRVLFVNTPANPSGWTASHETLRAILDLARRHDLWIIADEIYSLFHYGNAARAPSFFDIADPDDRILYVNSFSKNWAMTGWRVGWITIPAALRQVFENLVQYSTSGVALFMQRAAIAALDQGDDLIAEQVARSRQARDILGDRLRATGRVDWPAPEGAFYGYFRVEGEADGHRLALHLLDHANVGLAPGSAFGTETRDHLRACFNRDLGHIRTAADRMAEVIAAL